MAAVEYPPPGHVLRMLGIALDQTAQGEAGASEVGVSMPVTPAICGADGNARLAVIGTMVDLAAGVMAVRSTAPDWTATFELTIHHIAPAPPGTMLAGRCRLVRGGRNTVVSETLVEADGEPCAYSEVTYIRFPRPVDARAATPGTGVVDYRQTEPPLAVPIDELIGFRADAAGQVGFDLSAPIRNSFGSIQGGMSAVALEQAALSTRSADAIGTFLHVYYVSPAKVGPYVARATPLRSVAGGTTCRVELRDAGADRVLVQGTAIVE
jgi:acyl-coenzyme A thioesterase PaaI-like protein